MAKRKNSFQSLKLIGFLFFVFVGLLILLKPEFISKFFHSVDIPLPEVKANGNGKGSGSEEKRNPAEALSEKRARHLEFGLPKDDSESDDFLIERDQYVLSYNKKRRVANWVSWNLNKHWFGKVERFRGKFMPDPLLPSSFPKVTHDDYTGSGYDRGHLVRSEERTKTEADNLTTFYTTNILPQRHELNGGPWLRLEEYCQKLCIKGDKELYILAGGIFETKSNTIGRGVAVPISTWKIVVVLEEGEGLSDASESTAIIAVNMPNEGVSKSDKWPSFLTSVDELEKLTGYDFLSELPDDLEAMLEQKVFGK
ncbi:MAG: DNA/RNA non-specific endonuclease [Chloroherpetonaceae bacterium]|nr:DNA/RNA non-specific endonuclease [Chloroherpetonaceae bacterium]